MPSDVITALAILAGSGAVVGAIQFLPPLTASEAPISRQTEQGRITTDEHAYCRTNLPGVDCTCFAQKAVQVMSQDNTRVRGWSYADRWDLALAQAAPACR